MRGSRADEGVEQLRHLRERDRPRGKQIAVLSVSDMRARPRPSWLVRQLLPGRGLAVVYGASGAGKTFAVLDMALAIVRGVPWFGRRVRQGRVVYVAAEGALWLRLAAYMRHHGLVDVDLDGLAVVEQQINLLDADGDLLALVGAIRAAMQARGWERVDLVVVDTLNRAMPGGNENASEDMGRMVGAAEDIAEALGCAVLYVHHAGKDASKGSRGHSSLKAAAEAEISVRGNGDGPRVICAEKVREAESCVDVGAFCLEQVDLGATRENDPEADDDERDWSCVVVPCELPERSRRAALPAPQRLALDYLHRALDTAAEIPPREVVLGAGKRGPSPGQTACRVEHWRDYAVAAGGLSGSDMPATHRQAFHRCRVALERAAAVGVFDGWVWLRDKRDNGATGSFCRAVKSRV